MTEDKKQEERKFTVDESSKLMAEAYSLKAIPTSFDYDGSVFYLLSITPRSSGAKYEASYFSDFTTHGQMHMPQLELKIDFKFEED